MIDFLQPIALFFSVLAAGAMLFAFTLEKITDRHYRRKRERELSTGYRNEMIRKGKQ